MNRERVILLLGQRDHPTDGVADYCEQLAQAGGAHGLSFETVQIPWAEKGWRRALAELSEAAKAWRGTWVFLQYTTLAWSRRGFPIRAPRVLEVLRQCGARPGVVFHDISPLSGKGIAGAVREFCQLQTLSRLYARSELAIFTVPIKKIPWLPLHRGKAIFIPVGPNCRELPHDPVRKNHDKFTVAVYGVTGGPHIKTEVGDIAFGLKQIGQSGQPIRLLVFGRHSADAEPVLRSALVGANIEIEILGLLPPEQVTAAFVRSDVLLFVRGQISTRRGSAIAAIACGLPVVCYSGPDTDWPVTEAGILAVPYRDRDALAGALENIFIDSHLRKTLADRSRNAYEKYFSWPAITANFHVAIGAIPPVGETDLSRDRSAEA